MSAPATLLLSRALVAQLATPKDYLSAMRLAFADLAEGRVELSGVGHVSGIDGALHIKAARRAAAPTFAVVKVNGNFPQNGIRYQLPTIQGFIALLDTERGCVLALIDTVEITARRTAAATALAAQYLGSPDARTVGIIGCGVPAKYHIEALVEIAPVRSVIYCDPNDNAASSFETPPASRQSCCRGFGCASINDGRFASRHRDRPDDCGCDPQRVSRCRGWKSCCTQGQDRTIGCSTPPAWQSRILPRLRWCMNWRKRTGMFRGCSSTIDLLRPGVRLIPGRLAPGVQRVVDQHRLFEQ